MEIVAYEPWHLRSLTLQPAQSGMSRHLQSDLPERVPQCGPCWTALVDGKPVACAGFVEQAGRLKGWSAISETAGKHMVALTRAVRKTLAHQEAPIEMTVADGFTAGDRWARLLGFEESGLLPEYYEGQDHRAFVLPKNTLSCVDPDRL